MRYYLAYSWVRHAGAPVLFFIYATCCCLWSGWCGGTPAVDWMDESPVRCRSCGLFPVRLWTPLHVPCAAAHAFAQSSFSWRGVAWVWGCHRRTYASTPCGSRGLHGCIGRTGSSCRFYHRIRNLWTKIRKTSIRCSGCTNCYGSFISIASLLSYDSVNLTIPKIILPRVNSIRGK